MSKGQEEYFLELQKQVDIEYDIAGQARAQGKDPRLTIEMPQAQDMASRVHQLLEFLEGRNTAQQIRDLIAKHDGNREMASLDLARIVARETITQKFDLDEEDLERQFQIDVKEATEQLMGEAIYHGVCAGLAVLTEGILVAPLEGVVNCNVLANADGSKCLSVNYAGPIRSAGGTGQALSVLLAEILRNDFNLDKPQMTDMEIERYVEEMLLYPNLQYRPPAKDLRRIAKAIPIYITGEGVGKEVSGGRDLPRVDSNNVREGMLLVLCEGMLLKAPKIMKYVEQLGLEGWDFLNQWVTSKDEDDDEVIEFKPKDKYISDLVAGRPILGFPMEKGNFRLRYGRSRNAGLAACSMNSASMLATGQFIIPATQLKIERPGKATVASPCDSIDGPYIQLKDGSAKRYDYAELDSLLDGEYIFNCEDVALIWDLGELLVPLGEFSENNHPLMDSPYVPEWHAQVIEGPYPTSFDEALQMAENGAAMAPEYIAHFPDITGQELLDLFQLCKADMCHGFLQVQPEGLDLVYRLNVNVDKEGRLYGDKAAVLTNAWGAWTKKRMTTTTHNSALDLVNELVDYEVRPTVTYRIGTRMAKNEKTNLREMKPPIHGLIPVGHDVRSRLIHDAARIGKKPMQIGWRYCPDCLKADTTPEAVREQIKEGSKPEFLTTNLVCDKHGTQTEFLFSPSYYDEQEEWPVMDFETMWSDAVATTGSTDRGIKGVLGMTSREKIPEALEKAFLRKKNDVSVFRDGTIRFDMVDMTITHFKLSEIGLSVEKARELGYEVESVEDIVEIKIQDFIAPTSLAETFVNTAKFVDDELELLYGMERYYNAEKPEDLIGTLFATLAPHTSGTILCRLIGFSDIKGGYFHPYTVAGRRRNADGDIDSCIFLLDCLLNFSRTFLSAQRGGQMDAPLILTTRINPAEIDKEAMNMDTSWKYSTELYEATLKNISAKELSEYSEFAEQRLGTEGQYEGWGYTHEVGDIGEGPTSGPYTLLDMDGKIDSQFALGELLYSVDNEKQSSKLIDRHLLRDVRGNMRAFGQQKVRCTKDKRHAYRRPPLGDKCRRTIGKSKKPLCPNCGHYHQAAVLPESCTKCDTSLWIVERCGGSLTMTVYPTSVTKYFGKINRLIDKYGCNEYNLQRFRMYEDWAVELFDEKETKQTGLEDFF